MYSEKKKFHEAVNNSTREGRTKVERDKILFEKQFLFIFSKKC